VRPLIPLPSFIGTMLSPLCRRRPLRSSSPTLSPRARTWASIGAATKKTVLIAGAGPVGLTLSALLSRYGVPNLVFEKSSKLSHHPQVSTGAGPRKDGLSESRGCASAWEGSKHLDHISKVFFLLASTRWDVGEGVLMNVVKKRGRERVYLEFQVDE
jgi:hypothetical protein